MGRNTSRQWVCFFILIKFKFLNLQALTTWYCQLLWHPCLKGSFLWNEMLIGFVCICRLFVCISFPNVNIATLYLMLWYDYLQTCISFPIGALFSDNEAAFDTTVFVLFSPHYKYVNCVPRVCLKGALPSEVSSQATTWIWVNHAAQQEPLPDKTCIRCQTWMQLAPAWISAVHQWSC